MVIVAVLHVGGDAVRRLEPAVLLHAPVLVELAIACRNTKKRETNESCPRGGGLVRALHSP